MEQRYWGEKKSPSMKSVAGNSKPEKHISIDSKRGTDSKFSLVAKDFSNFRKAVDKAYIIKGKNFFYRKKSELKNKRYRRSIFASKEIKCGEKFTEKNIQIIIVQMK